jgi:drug/metabolite transporter (DMT)-like permease
MPEVLLRFCVRAVSRAIMCSVMTSGKGGLKYSLVILLAAFLWGTTFVAQRMGMENLEPLFFNSIRMVMGGIVLIPIYFVTEWLHKRNRNNAAELSSKQNPEAELSPEQKHDKRKYMIIGGIILGFILFAASNFQQFGLVTTSAGKSGFLTAMYIVMVPVFGIFLKHRIRISAWIAVVLAVAGLYFLCITNGLHLAIGDIYTLICALFYTLHILVTNHFAPKTNVTGLVCFQSLLCGALGLIIAPFVENITFDDFVVCLPALLYAGLLSTAMAYTLQAYGQRGANPTVASVMMSMEALFAVLAGFVVLGETFTPREMIGCVLMFAAIILAQLPPPRSVEKER